MYTLSTVRVPSDQGRPVPTQQTQNVEPMSIVLMLFQRHGRCSNYKTALEQHLVLAGYSLLLI